MSFSPLIQQLIDQLRCLPGVGPKSAQRMAFFLLERDRESALELARVMDEAAQNVGNCERCHALSESSLCQICADSAREPGLLCVLESPMDVLAIEQTGGFAGYYHVLGGHLSPLDGIGPEELALDKLLLRVESEPISEVILATNPTVEGEATAHYIAEQLKHLPIKLSRIAHGVPVGGELEYVDGGTLAHALAGRRQL